MLGSLDITSELSRGTDVRIELPIRQHRARTEPADGTNSQYHFQVYDPVSKILYSGDLGASLGRPYRIVPDDRIDEHLVSMEGFHKRYMSGGLAMKAWAKMARPLDIEQIAPQHGSVMTSRAAWTSSPTFTNFRPDRYDGGARRLDLGRPLGMLDK